MREVRQLKEQWRFKACDEQEWLPAEVPGCVHTDLLRNVRIKDPFYGTNEHGLQWIDRKDWEYECEFHVSQDWMVMPHLELVFAGLDTYAEVYVNGKHVLSADNMFRTWKADVKELVREGSNHLRVKFRSPVLEDLPKLERLGYAFPAQNDQSELGGLGENRVSVFARKAPYHWLGLGTALRDQRYLAGGPVGGLEGHPDHRSLHPATRGFRDFSTVDSRCGSGVEC